MMPFVRLRVILIINNVPSKDNCTYFLTLQVNFSFGLQLRKTKTSFFNDGGQKLSYFTFEIEFRNINAD